MAGEFRRARQALAGAPRRRIFPGVPETVRRERFLARRLRRLVSRHRRVVHLGGWEHLVAWEDSPGLWRDLADLKPQASASGRSGPAAGLLKENLVAQASRLCMTKVRSAHPARLFRKNYGGTGILPVRRTGWKPVPPKAAGARGPPHRILPVLRLGQRHRHE